MTPDCAQVSHWQLPHEPHGLHALPSAGGSGPHSGGGGLHDDGLSTQTPPLHVYPVEQQPSL
jgi:hypothetical protein